MVRHRYVTRIFFCLMATAMVFSLFACGKAENEQNT